MAIINLTDSQDPSRFTFSALGESLFSPLSKILETADFTRQCPEFPDSDWLKMGVTRCLLSAKSGRDFLQRFDGLCSDGAMHRATFFGTLKSKRRLEMCATANEKLCGHIAKTHGNGLSSMPGLEKFAVYAADGHFHSAAAHDPIIEGSKRPVGHIFCLNLRTHAATHLTVADQVNCKKREHEMRTLKRMNIKALRQGASKGTKVLYAYDRACIDFTQWETWKQGSGIYMITLVKANMAPIKCGDRVVDHSDPHNAGVISDEYIGSASGVHLRRITFKDMATGTVYVYVTNEMTLLPGVLAQIYKMRWDIEKMYDETKNKFGQTKAWASSAEAKTMQAIFICMTHNLLLCLEVILEKEEGLINVAEEKRKAERLRLTISQVAEAGAVLPTGRLAIQRSTQRSVKLIRWVGSRLFSAVSWAVACVALKNLYSEL